MTVLSFGVVLPFHRIYCRWFVYVYLIINYSREKYYSVQTNMFFASHLFQVCWKQSLTMHSNLKQALCKWVEVNLNNIANVQYNYLLIFTKKNCLEWIVSIVFITICYRLIFVASFPTVCVWNCLHFQARKFTVIYISMVYTSIYVLI